MFSSQVWVEVEDVAEIVKHNLSTDPTDENNEESLVRYVFKKIPFGFQETGYSCFAVKVKFLETLQIP